MAYYKSPYIQRYVISYILKNSFFYFFVRSSDHSLLFRGYGIGFVFNSMLRFFKPAGRKIARLLKEPAAKEVLKNIGKEAASTGTEILLKKLKRGQNLRSKSEERIKRAKKKISRSLNDTVKLKSKGSNIKYYKLDSDSDDGSFEYKRRNELITKNSQKSKDHHNTKDKKVVKHYQLSKDFSDESSSTDEYSARHSKKAKEGTIQSLTPKKKRNRIKLKHNDYYRSVFD